MSVTLLDFRYNGRQIPDARSGLQTFWYFESMRGCASYRLHFKTFDWDTWDRVARNGPDTKATLQWGRTEAQKKLYVDKKTVLINFASFRWEGPSLYVDIQSSCGGYVLAERRKSRAWRKARISGVVGEIAEDHGLKPDIEPTMGTQDYYQTSMQDGPFIRKVLMPSAVSPAGRGDYMFWVRDGKELVFRTPEIGAPSHTFDFPSGLIAEVPIQDGVVRYRRGLIGAEDGSLSTNVRAVDPVRKRPIFFTVDDDTAQYKDYASKKPKAPELECDTAVITGALNDDYGLDNIKKMARAIWGRNMHSMFRMEIATLGMTTARLGQVFNIRFSEAKKNHVFNGKYLLHAILHTVSDQTYRTVLFLERRMMK